MTQALVLTKPQIRGRQENTRGVNRSNFPPINLVLKKFKGLISSIFKSDFTKYKLEPEGLMLKPVFSKEELVDMLRFAPKFGLEKVKPLFQKFLDHIRQLYKWFKDRLSARFKKIDRFTAYLNLK